MKKIILIVITVVLSLGLVSCSRSAKKINDKKTDILEHDTTDASILTRVNNTSSINSLITEEFDMSDYYNSSLSLWFEFIEQNIHEVDNKLKIECLRQNGEKLYAVYKSRQGGLMYVLFELSEEESRYVSTDVAYYERPIYVSNFEKLVCNESTIADVRKIDPYPYEILTAGSAEPYSHHRLFDGWEAYILYVSPVDKAPGENFENIVVSDISFFRDSKNINSVYHYLSPADLPDSIIDKAN